MLWAFRDRMLDLKKDRRFRYILIFKNHGEPAGASLEHSHSQLIALPIVPSTCSEEMEGAKQYYIYKERCVFCDIIRQETETGSPRGRRKREFPHLAPYAPRFPFETWILPKRHESASRTPRRTCIENLAKALKTPADAAPTRCSTIPPTTWSSTLPRPGSRLDFYHWHIEFMPGSPRQPASNGAPASTRIPRRPRKLPNTCAKPRLKFSSRLG